MLHFSRKFFLDHIQALEEPNELLIKQSKMEEQLQLLSSGFNAGIFTLNTRDPNTGSNGLLIMALNILKEMHRELDYVRIFYCMIGLTDRKCIDLITERSIQVNFIQKKLSSLYTQASSIDDLIILLQRSYSIPFILLIKLDGMYEFQSQLCLADLGWTHVTSKLPRTTPFLTQSLSKLKDIAHLLYQMPYHGRIHYDGCQLTALSKDFIGGNSRTSFIFKVDLDDPETPELLKFADLLRKVKHFVQPTRCDPSLFLKEEKLEKLSIDLQQLEYTIEQQQELVDEQRMALVEKEKEIFNYKSELEKNDQFITAMNTEFQDLQTSLVEAQNQVAQLTKQGFQYQLQLLEARDNMKALMYHKIRMEYERELATMATHLLETELHESATHLSIQETLGAFYLQQRQEMEESDLKMRHEVEHLLQEYNQLSEYAAEMKVKVKELKLAEKQVVKSTKRIEKLTEQYQQNILELKFQLENSEKTQEKLNQELIQKNEEIKVLTSTCEKKENQLNELQRNLHQLESQLISVNQELHTEKDQRELNHQNLRRTFLEREKKSLQRLDQVRAKKEELQSEYDQLQFSFQQLQQDALDHDSKLSAAQSKIKTLEKQLQQHRTQHAKTFSKDPPEWIEMKETWDRQESELYKEIEDLNTKIKKSEIQKKSAQTEIKRLQASLMGAESMNKEFEDSMSTLNTKLNAKEKQVLTLQHDLQQHKTQLEQLKQKVSWHEQTSLNKDKQLQTLNDQLVALKQELRSSHSELEAVTNELERHQSMNADASASRSKEKQHRQALLQAKEELQKEKEKNRKEVTRLQAQYDQLQENQKNLEKQSTFKSPLPIPSQSTPTPIRSSSELHRPRLNDTFTTLPKPHTSTTPVKPFTLPSATTPVHEKDNSETGLVRLTRQTAIKSNKKTNEVRPEIEVSSSSSSSSLVRKKSKKNRTRSLSPDSTSNASTRSLPPATLALVTASPTMLSPTLAALAPSESPPSLTKLRKKRKLGAPKSMLHILDEPQSKLGNALSFLNESFNFPNLREQIHLNSEKKHE
ncbi:hypothetical protein HMI55_005278 [Coelomomyces lativittatus]|nr:hypothetical protein HMI55_005278 [Coelomomyces lativittatus]